MEQSARNGVPSTYRVATLVHGEAGELIAASAIEVPAQGGTPGE